MTKYTPILIAAAGLLAIAISLMITDGIHKFSHRSTVFSPPEPGVSSPQSGPALTNFSSPSSEAGQEQVVPALAFIFDDLLDAIEWVESKGDPWAVGDDGDAVGAYQIRKIYVDDVNRIWGVLWKKFSYKDRYSKSKSRFMVRVFLNHYGGTFEEMARKHNGGPNGHNKPSTEAYWLKVKARMETK